MRRPGTGTSAGTSPGTSPCLRLSLHRLVASPLALFPALLLAAALPAAAAAGAQPPDGSPARAEVEARAGQARAAPRSPAPTAPRAPAGKRAEGRQPGETKPTVDILVRSPREGRAVFGTLDMAVEVLGSEPVRAVSFYLDDRLAERRERPPWRTRLDVGDENVERTFRFVVETASGATFERVVVTPPLEVDDAMDLGLMQLYVTAQRGDERTRGLERSDFRVFDDGEPQEIVTFEGGDVPLTAVLLMDASESMRGERLEAALAGARAFVRRMQELDLAKLLLFADRPLLLTPFAEDEAALAAAIPAELEATGGTALNDHLYAALRILDERHGRRVVVLLSDGSDVLSALSMEDVLWKLRRSNAMVYWIRLEDRGEDAGHFSSAWRDFEGNARELELLERAIAESGGRIVTVPGLGELDDAFEEVVAELREQYVLGYYPTTARDDGSFHQVRVRIRAGGVRARTREGYVDD